MLHLCFIKASQKYDTVSKLKLYLSDINIVKIDLSLSRWSFNFFFFIYIQINLKKLIFNLSRYYLHSILVGNVNIKDGIYPLKGA